MAQEKRSRRKDLFSVRVQDSGLVPDSVPGDFMICEPSFGFDTPGVYLVDGSGGARLFRVEISGSGCDVVLSRSDADQSRFILTLPEFRDRVCGKAVAGYRALA